MKYTLGLDIGAASIGWAILDREEHALEFGVHIFPAGEARTATGKLKTPATPRRLAKSARRRLRRAAYRREKAKELFALHGLIPDLPTGDERFRLRNHPSFIPAEGKLSPWQLRADALRRLLTGEELARALLHIIKRRGFKSSRKGGFDLYATAADSDEDSQPSDTERAKEEYGMKRGVRALAQKLRESEFNTLGEMLNAEGGAGRKRNRAKDYRFTGYRDLLQEEVTLIFARQQEQGSPFASLKLEQRFMKLLLHVKPAMTAEDLEARVGRCTFFKDEKRSPKNTWTAERCMLLGKVNSLNYWQGAEKLFLTAEQRALVVDLAYRNKAVLYSQVRTLLGLPEEARFTAVNYRGKRTKDEHNPPDKTPAEAETCRFVSLPGYHTLREELEKAGVWEATCHDTARQDFLARSLFYHKSEDDLRNALAGIGADPAVIGAACNILPEGFTGTSDLSHKALSLILPHLEAGAQFSEACAHAGLAPETDCEPDPEGLKILPGHLPPNILINPVAHRALSRCRKLVNALIAKYGKPEAVHIELARDLRRSVEERADEADRIKDNEKRNEQVDQQIRDYGAIPSSSSNRLKYKIWLVQEKKCAYCQQALDPRDWLLDADYAELDHIIRKSLSLDNSPTNLVLVHTSCNRNKGTELACNYVKRVFPDAWDTYREWASNLSDSGRKSRLLKTDFDEEEQQRWQARYLHDTSTITSTFAEVLRKNLYPDGDRKRRVYCFQGGIVSEARKWWGLPKDRYDNLHHAVDAVVVASLRHHQIELLLLHARVIETRQKAVDSETGEVIEWRENGSKKPRLPLPWRGFRDQFFQLWEAAHRPIGAEVFDRVYESQLPTRRMAGQMHKDTISRIETGEEKGLRVRHGVAALDSILRLDVFRVPARGGKTQYHVVPVYAADFLARKLPEAPGLFYMSIFKGELVRVILKGKVSVGHLTSANGQRLKLSPLPSDDTTALNAAAQGKIRSREAARGDNWSVSYEDIDTGGAKTHRPAPVLEPSIKTASTFEKFSVGLLGDVHRVKRHQREDLAPRRGRNGLANRSNNKTREPSD